jgi:DedD protein
VDGKRSRDSRRIAAPAPVAIGDAEEEERGRAAQVKGKVVHGRYVVQLASVSSAARAEQLRSASARKGYTAVVQTIGARGKQQYRVRIEGFGSRKAAERAAARLRRAGNGLKPIILSAGG